MANRAMYRQAPGVAPAYAQSSRNNRRPQHTFNVACRPFVIQPFLIAPVLAGETMRNLLIQSRVVTDPLANPLIGWWHEYHFFYVKLTDLDEREQVMEMLLRNADLSSLAGSYQQDTNHRIYPGEGTNGGVNWTRLCLKRVVEEYFRDEGETWLEYKVPGSTGVNMATAYDMPIASIKQQTILQSATATDALEDIDIEVDANSDGDITASEVDSAMREWEILRANNFTEMSYEDYLRSFGVRTPQERPHTPELIRTIREWTYPANTVNPATGGVNSAASWSIVDRADKDRFFREPGFIFGVTVTRPKIYLGGLGIAGTHFLTEMMDWLPAQLHGDDASAFKAFAEKRGPMPWWNTGDDQGYTLDMRDLFIYGDQFIAGALEDTDRNILEIGGNLANLRYPDSASIDELFKNAVVSGNRVKMDGLVSLTIAGRQRDRTPGQVAQA